MQPERSYNPWLVLLTLCLGFFMILLDTTIVNIAIPDITTRLGASLDEILWVLNAYVMVYAVLLITAGRLGDLYGPRRLFLAGLVMFTLASAACGLARSPEQLIGARIVQGVGAAVLTPQTLSTITMIFPPAKRGAAFGVWGAVAGVAAVTGPTLGGLLVTAFDWRWIFYVNVPVGVLTLVLAGIVMPDLKLNRRHRLDWRGTALASAGLFLVTYGLIEGQPHDWGAVWGPVTIPMVIVAGVLVLVGFLYQQYAERDREPLVPFSIFRDRNFALMNIVAAGMGFTMLGLFVPVVIYLQSVLGLSALQAGLALAPMSLLSMVVAPAAGRLADRMGGKYLLIAGLALFMLGMAILMAAAQVDSGRRHLLPGLLVAGLGLGLTFAPMQTIAMRDIQPRVAGAASGLINTARLLGSVIGSAAVGALLQAQLATRLRESAAAHAGQLPPELRDPAVTAFTDAESGGLQIGTGQTGVELPPGLPEQVTGAIRAFAGAVFRDAFTEATRVSLVLPMAALAGAAMACLFVRRPGAADQATGAGAAGEAGRAEPVGTPPG